MKQKQIRCPYCGSIAILRDASYVYGNKAKDGKLYVCSHFPQCNSYVGVHPGTTNAKGKLANKELRQKRIQAHRVFDQIWLNHIFTNEYSCAVTPQVRQTGNRLSGLAGTAYASLLT